MARRKATEGIVEIVIEGGRCGDGCGAEVAKGRRFRQGHDARLRSILGRAHKAGQQVRIVNDGTATTRAAQAELEARAWPVPKGQEPKAVKATPTSRPRTRKAATAKA